MTFCATRSLLLSQLSPVLVQQQQQQRLFSSKVRQQIKTKTGIQQKRFRRPVRKESLYANKNRPSVIPLQGNILLLGEGDFSFAAALSKLNSYQGSASIFATGFERRRIAVAQYKHAQANLECLQRNQNVLVRHKVDATQLADVPLGGSKSPYTKRWDSIVWNFPYPASSDHADIHSTTSVCRTLVQDVLVSARPLLKEPNGKVYITTLAQHLTTASTTTTNDATPRTWNVLELLAQKAELQLLDAIPFDRDHYPGYVPKRSLVDESFSCRDAVTLVFGRSHVPRPSARETSVNKL